MSYVRLTDALGLDLSRGRLGVVAWSIYLYIGVNIWTWFRLDSQSDIGYGRKTVKTEVAFAWFHAGVARQGRTVI